MVGSNAVKMLAVFLVIGFFTSGAAQARKRAGKPVASVRSFAVNDAELGGFKIEILDKGHPVLLPYRVSVLLICKDRRANPSGTGPKLEIILDGEPSCKFVTHAYNREKSELTVEYWISTTMDGEGKCDTKVEQAYNLADLCAEYRP